MELPAKLQEFFLRSNKSNVNQLGVTQTLVFSSSEQDGRTGCGSHPVYIYIYIHTTLHKDQGDQGDFLSVSPEGAIHFPPFFLCVSTSLV